MKPAVLFDLGDVLCRLRFERGLVRLRALGVPGAAAEAERAFVSDLAREFNLGRHPTEGFLQRLGARLGRGELSSDVVAEAWCDVFDPWPEMTSLAEEVLAAGHPVWVLSNTDPLHFATLRRQVPLLGRVTGLFLSYERGLAKPDPQYFTAFLEHAGLPAEACLFLDDRADNVAAAERCGIVAHRHDGDVAAARAFLVRGGVALA